MYSVCIDEKVREDIDKYKQIGTAKKQLYSMPQYFRDREQKGIKLPANKLQGKSIDKDPIKLQGDLILGIYNKLSTLHRFCIYRK